MQLPPPALTNQVYVYTHMCMCIPVCVCVYVYINILTWMSCREVSWNLHCPVRFQWMSPRGCELVRHCNQAYHLVLLLCSVCRTSRFWQKDGISTGWSSLCILLIPKGHFGELFPPNQKYWKIVVGCKWRINKGICRGWNLGWWIIQILTVTLAFSKMCFPLSTTHLSTSSPIWAMILSYYACLQKLPAGPSAGVLLPFVNQS